MATQLLPPLTGHAMKMVLTPEPIDCGRSIPNNIIIGKDGSLFNVHHLPNAVLIQSEATGRVAVIATEELVFLVETYGLGQKPPTDDGLLVGVEQ
ncbi:MAG: hypothetical protein JSS89_13130 [Bacteroidetes bacterium]|nr:hypothetical protein [Bacteroidota bacterium]